MRFRHVYKLGGPRFASASVGRCRWDFGFVLFCALDSRNLLFLVVVILLPLLACGSPHYYIKFYRTCTLFSHAHKACSYLPPLLYIYLWSVGFIICID